VVVGRANTGGVQAVQWSLPGKGTVFDSAANVPLDRVVLV
jgi:hypothetical protein